LLKGLTKVPGVTLSILKNTARYFGRKDFCRAAIQEHADLSVFEKKLTTSVIAGLVLIVVSYLIGLPTAVIIGGIVMAEFNFLIAAIITALIYGISWLLFMLGLYLAGPKYGKAFSRWVVRVVLEKILGAEARTIACIPGESQEGTNIKK
jgi:ABC-type microcin C transport system permease subunit YejB